MISLYGGWSCDQHSFGVERENQTNDSVKEINNSQRSSGKMLTNNFHHWNGLATIAIKNLLQGTFVVKILWILRIPAVVLDHVRQLYDEFTFLVFLARFERVFLSVSNDMKKKLATFQTRFSWNDHLFLTASKS